MVEARQSYEHYTQTAYIAKIIILTVTQAEFFNPLNALQITVGTNKSIK